MATTETLQDRRDALLDEVISFTAEMGSIEDAQAAESLDKRREAIHAEAEELKEQMAKDAKAWREDAEGQTLEAAYEITPGGKKGFQERVQNARGSVRAFQRRQIKNLREGINTAWTDLPAVISPNAAPPGSGPVPEFHCENTANKIAGAVHGKQVSAHEFTQARLRVPEEQMDMFPDISIGFVSEEDADGERTEKSYQALALPDGKFLSATTSGTGAAAGAGLVPQGTLFQPQVQGLDQFNGPMEMAGYFNYKVTPGDINPMKWLRFTARGAVSDRAENVPKSVTDHTTDEIEVGCTKVAWDGEITKEALMRNYVNDFFGAYNETALNEFKAESSSLLTKGSGTGTEPLGIVTAIDAIGSVPTHSIPRAATVGALTLNQVTLLEMKRLLSVGLRRAPIIFMARDAIIWEMLINQLNATAPGYSLPLENGGANDGMGYHGRMWGLELQTNEDIDDDINVAGSTIAIVLAGKDICVRTTGTTNTMNVWDEMARDVISVYIRAWIGLQIIKPQVARNFSVGRMTVV